MTQDEIQKIVGMIDACIAELSGYENLGPGWDGYSGVMFPPKIIAHVKIAARSVGMLFIALGHSPTEITPGPGCDGSVDLEIGFCGRSLILIFEDETVSVYHETPRNPSEKIIKWDELDLGEEIKRLIHGT